MLTLQDLAGLDFTDRGAPFCEGAAKASVLLGTLDYVRRGAPFVRNPGAGGVPTPLHLSISVTATLEGRTFVGTLAGDLAEV